MSSATLVFPMRLVGLDLVRARTSVTAGSSAMVPMNATVALLASESVRAAKFSAGHRFEAQPAPAWHITSFLEGSKSARRLLTDWSDSGVGVRPKSVRVAPPAARATSTYWSTTWIEVGAGMTG